MWVQVQGFLGVGKHYSHVFITFPEVYFGVHICES